MNKTRLEGFSDAVIAISLAFVNQWISDAIDVTVALIWFIPDHRIERTMNK